MKKILAFALALVMILSVASFAAAEQRTYLMTGVIDAEGNVATLEDVDLPVLVFGMDDETMECAFGKVNDEGAVETIEGTAEIVGQEESNVYLKLTLADGSEVAITYLGEMDVFGYLDEATGVSMLMEQVELEEEAA